MTGRKETMGEKEIDEVEDSCEKQYAKCAERIIKMKCVYADSCYDD